MSHSGGFRIKPLRKVAKGSTRETIDTLHNNTIDNLLNGNSKSVELEKSIYQLSNHKNEISGDIHKI